MMKRMPKLVVFLLAVMLTFALGATMKVTAEAASEKDVVTLNSSEIKNWEVGKEGPFKVYVNGVQVDRTTMIWDSSNTAVATCVNGKLVGKSAGTTTITCTKANGTTATCKVTVIGGKDVVTLNTSEIKNWEVGKEGPFKVYVNGVQVDRTTMIWDSSNPSVATCVNGKLIGKSAGTTTITCTKVNGTTATCKVTVVGGKDVVTLNTSEIKNWEVGQSGPFKVYVNGVQVDRTTMIWSSSNTAVATCVNGKLVGKSAGTTTITCTKTNGTTATCKVTVVKGKDVVTLNASEIKNWEVGQEGPFKAYVNGVQVDRTTMTWNSSNPSVATCVNGKLVGKSAGTTTITCTKTNGTTASCKVTVVKGKDVVTLNTSAIKNWEVGQSGQFKVYVNGVQVDRTTMTWSSSNPSVATCVNGRLVGKSAGTTIITCTKTNGTTATCTVTVKAPSTTAPIVQKNGQVDDNLFKRAEDSFETIVKKMRADGLVKESDVCVTMDGTTIEADVTLGDGIADIILVKDKDTGVYMLSLHDDFLWLSNMMDPINGIDPGDYCREMLMSMLAVVSDVPEEPFYAIDHFYFGEYPLIGPEWAKTGDCQMVCAYGKEGYFSVYIKKEGEPISLTVNGPVGSYQEKIGYIIRYDYEKQEFNLIAFELPGVYFTWYQFTKPMMGYYGNAVYDENFGGYLFDYEATFYFYGDDSYFDADLKPSLEFFFETEYEGRYVVYKRNLRGESEPDTYSLVYRIAPDMWVDVRIDDRVKTGSVEDILDIFMIDDFEIVKEVY